MIQALMVSMGYNYNGRLRSAGAAASRRRICAAIAALSIELIDLAMLAFILGSDFSDLAQPTTQKRHTLEARKLWI